MSRGGPSFTKALEWQEHIRTCSFQRNERKAVRSTTQALCAKTAPSDTSCCVPVDEAVAVAHNAAFANMGQVCNAGSRTFVHEDIYDEFVKKSVDKAKKRVIGDPFDLNTEAGPQASVLFPE